MFLAGVLRPFLRVALAHNRTKAMAIEIVKIVFPFTILDADLLKRTIAIATVEYLATVEHDLFAQPVRLDVSNERVELFALHQGKDVRERMEFEFFAHAADSSSFGGMPRMPLRAPNV